MVGKLFPIIVLMMILASLISGGAEQDEEIADIDWDNLQEIMNLDDAALVNALTAQPGLLENPAVMDALNIKVTAGRTDLINNHPAIMRAWGDDKGITITPNARIETYDGAAIKTRGLRATTFNPNDVQGAFVLVDGSLQLPSRYTISGIVEKEESGLAIMGELKDAAGNRLVNEKSHVTLETDGERVIIRSYGETKAYTKDGDFTTISGERSEYLLRFNEKNELTITTLALTTEDLKNPVKVMSPKPENNFVLFSGEATIKSANKILFEGIQIGATITPALFEIYGSGEEEQASGFTVTKPTLLCFDECDGLEKIKPTDYTASSIEVLRPMTYAGEQYERNILKITARGNNKIDAHLTNPDHDSIFLDAPGENRITLTQEGKVLQGTEVKPYYSSVTATDGMYTFRGKPDTELSGSKLLILGKDATFDEQNALVAGKILTFQPGVVGGIGFIEPEDGFDLLEYHLGKPLPARQKTVGEIITPEQMSEKDVPKMMDDLMEEGRQVDMTGAILPLDVEDVAAMAPEEFKRALRDSIAQVNTIEDADSIMDGIYLAESLDGYVSKKSLEGKPFKWEVFDRLQIQGHLWDRIKELKGDDFEGWSFDDLRRVERIAVMGVGRDPLYEHAFYKKELEKSGMQEALDWDIRARSALEIQSNPELLQRFCAQVWPRWGVYYKRMSSRMDELFIECFNQQGMER